MRFSKTFMARWCIFLAAGVFLATAGTGCTTTQLGRSWAMGSSKSNRATSEDLADEDTALIAARSAPRTGRQRSAEPAPLGRPSPFDSNRALPTSTQHSAATMALIDRELSDAAADEREPLLASLRNVPDETVRHILSERRKGLQLARRQRETTGTPRQDLSREPIIQASVVGDSERALGARAPRQSSDGVGTVSAWGHSTPGNPRNANRAPRIEIESVTESKTSTPVESPVRTADPQQFPAYANEQPLEQAAETAAPLAHGSAYRPETGTAKPLAPPAGAPAASAPLPASNAASAPATKPPAAKGNPILGYLMPGRFGGTQASPTKPGSPPAATSDTPKASVAVAVPRETSQNPGTATIDSATSNHAVSGELLAALIRTTETEIAELTPGDDDAARRAYVEKHVYLRMLYLIGGQQERALQAIPGIDVADQEFWQQTFWGLTNYFDTTSIPVPADRAAQTVSQLTKAILRLQEKANLDLKNVNFCHKIASFGNYDKYPRDEFSPGQEVLLYAEVVNIHSEPTSDGRFRTSLKSTLEIYRHGAVDEPVERIELPETIDLCRTHRRDYFHSYQFTIPPKLALGPHVLKLTVEDQLSRRATTYSLNFMVK